MMVYQAKNMSNEPEICAKCDLNFDPAVYPAEFLARFKAAADLCPVCMRSKLLKSSYFATGAHIVPREFYVDGFLGGFEWVVVEFEDDSFTDGQEFDPAETAPSLWGLMAQSYPGKEDTDE